MVARLVPKGVIHKHVASISAVKRCNQVTIWMLLLSTNLLVPLPPPLTPPKFTVLISKNGQVIGQ